MALFGAGRALATDLPTLTGSWREMCLSWNGCEFGRHCITARADKSPEEESDHIFNVFSDQQSRQNAQNSFLAEDHVDLSCKDDSPRLGAL